ncbi:MAG: MATE family efflux transporter [Rhodobacteraceae bacterium]|nr:MATE family efflux transporter [Paracoccaceae bacterium]
MAELTAPDAPLTHRRILNVAVPIVLSNATVPILGAVDTGVVGQIGDPVPIGAVGIGAIILGAVYWIFGFLRMGTVGLTSQALGAGDRAEADALLARALMIGFGAGLLMIAAQAAVFWAAFAVSPASAEVEALARDYMAIRIWSSPAAIAIFGITGWLIAAERTRAVLVIQLWMNAVNIVLDLWFVLGLGWGVEGVAFATFLAEWSGFGLALWLCRGAFKRPYWRQKARVFDIVRLRRFASIGNDILIRSISLEAIFVSFLFLGSDFGNVELAANQILLQFIHITAHALDGFAFSAESFVGQATGAKSARRVRRASVMTSVWGAATSIALGAVFLIFGPLVIDVMTTSEEVRETARVYLIYMALVPLLGAPAWMLDGIFIGATRSGDMRNMALLSAVIYFAFVFALVPSLANHGLWIAFLISFVARGVTLGARYPALERAVASG